MIRMPNNAVATNRGIGVVCGALGVAFVVLKLCGVLDWSWWWVLAPLWAPPVAALVIYAAALATKALLGRAGRTGAGVRRPPETVYEPVHGWTQRQLDGYLARNPGYRPTYEAELAKHR
jgi:hypothetical protein